MTNETIRPVRPAVIRIVAAIAVAMAFASGVYFLLEASRPNGLVSFSFLLVLPAAICGFIAYVADPWKERSRGRYHMIPVWVLLVVIVASIFILREGTICIVLLTPLWLISGSIGVEITYRLRRRSGDGRAYCTALFAIPLIAMQVEPMIPLPTATPEVMRSIDIDAAPEVIWPMLLGIPDVRPGEGGWNISQDVLGIPRPIGARLVGEGIGADRFANWGEHIRFRERITEWKANRRIGWRFIFDDVGGWGYTDRHLLPDSTYFTVTNGGYRMEPLGPNRTRVILETRYRITTPVNSYSELWGQLLLGDIENNLLAMIKQRAEKETKLLSR